MDSLLPFILLIALSVILSQKKKKNQEEESPDSYPQESPWDDFFPEKKEPEPPHSSPVQPPVSSSEVTTPVSVELPAPQPSYSYETESQSDISILDEAEESSSLESILLSTNDLDSNLSSEFFDKNRVQLSETSDGYVVDSSEDSRSTEEDKGVFPTGFDLRQAVLYSEIMKPRYTRDCLD